MVSNSRGLFKPLQQRRPFLLLCAGLLVLFCYALAFNHFLPCRGQGCWPASGVKVMDTGAAGAGAQAAVTAHDGDGGAGDLKLREASAANRAGLGVSQSQALEREQTAAVVGEQAAAIPEIRALKLQFQEEVMRAREEAEEAAAERAAAQAKPGSGSTQHAPGSVTNLAAGGGSIVTHVASGGLDTAVQDEGAGAAEMGDDADDGDVIIIKAHQSADSVEGSGSRARGGAAAGAHGAGRGGGVGGSSGALGNEQGTKDGPQQEPVVVDIRAAGAGYDVPPPMRTPLAAATPFVAREADDSVRCRQSGICDGQYTCSTADRLACITKAPERQQAVREAAIWSWKGYQEYCWGHDELKPLSGFCDKWFNMSLTMVDGLDTLLLMGLSQQAEDVRQWVAHAHSSAQDDDHASVFEVTIRVLGGLLSAFHLSGGDRLFLMRALELGLRLLPGFRTPTGIPYSDINLATHKASHPHWSTSSSLSEVGTLDVEFSYLARIAGRPELEEPALHALEQVLTLAQRYSKGHLLPMYVDPKRGRLKGRMLTLGARTDSYYEYLLKEWLLTGKRHGWLLKAYVDAMQAVRGTLLGKTQAHGLSYLAEAEDGTKFPKMDHLVCFMPGLFALGWLHGVDTRVHPEDASDLELAEGLATTCYEMYRQTPTGLASEIVFFLDDPSTKAGFPKQHVADIGNGDYIIKPADAHNLLRPETVESLFVLWRVTRDEKYREWGWNIFRAFEQHARVAGGGYACVDSVTEVPVSKRDKMESFWLAETLKYLYLLFDDTPGDLVPLTQFVFNTEAHPMPIQGSMADSAMSSHHLPAGLRAWQWRNSASSDAELDADLAAVAEEVARLAAAVPQPLLQQQPRPQDDNVHSLRQEQQQMADALEQQE